MTKKTYFIAAMFAGLVSAPALVLAEPENSEQTPPMQHTVPGTQANRPDSSSRFMLKGETKEDTDRLVSDSAKVFEQFKSGPNKIPDSSLSKAECVAIFPGVTSAALVVGGSHGDGVISCRGEAGKWSRVGFLDLSGASIGAQLGAKKTDMVLLLMNPKAKSALTKGSEIALGGDLSVAVGKYDASADISTGSSDVVAFAADRGLFAGVSLNGTRIAVDKDSMQAFYREPSGLDNTVSNFDLPSESKDTRDLINALSKSQS